MTMAAGMPEESLSYLAIGSIGTGFLEESLERGLATGVDFIGADAGSVDGGPDALAGGPAIWPDASNSRDLGLLLRGARRIGVPLLVGSCATSGRDWGVDLFADFARRVAKEHGLPKFTLARIYSEVSPELVVERLRAGRIHPIEPAPDYDVEAILRSIRIVTVMGAEPFQAALDRGADVVLAGRATDTAIFAAIPLARGFDPGVAWHAGKIAECGTSSAEPRRRLDVLHVELGRDSFTVQPLADDIRCTPFSVAAHQLHEVADPFTLVEPGWVTDMAAARYEAASDRAVRVSGSVAIPSRYTVKLEGVESAGYQRMFMLGVRDPTILADMERWMAGIQADIRTRCEELLGKGALERFQTHVRLYGRDGVMGPREPVKRFEGHEAFVVVDVTAPDPDVCETATSVIWYAFMHAKSPGWRGGTTVAWPFPRSTHDMGQVFQFNVHHAMEVDDPLETFRIELEEVG
jgi:hypothetical protein